MRERDRTRRNGSRPPPQRNEYFANASAVGGPLTLTDVDKRRSARAHDQPRPFGGAIFTRPHEDIKTTPGGLRFYRQ
jgi:hypothetical protein